MERHLIEQPQDGKKEKQDTSWKLVKEELEILSRIGSPSRFEGGVHNYLEGKAVQLGIETVTDAKGNLWLVSDKPEGEVLVSAHMDKVGTGSRLKEEENTVEGRLDDALGISIIMGLLKEGKRPTVLFTVEEESQREVVQKDGERIIKERQLSDGIYNAGARHAIDEIYKERVDKPKLMIFVDTSANDQIGKGVLIAKSSFDFSFPIETIKNVKAILDKEGISVRYWDAGGTDAIEASFLDKQPVVLIEVPTKNYHTDHEIADQRDIINATAAARAMIENRNMIVGDVTNPVHALNRNKTIIVSEKEGEINKTD